MIWRNRNDSISDAAWKAHWKCLQHSRAATWRWTMNEVSLQPFFVCKNGASCCIMDEQSWHVTWKTAKALRNFSSFFQAIISFFELEENFLWRCSTLGTSFNSSTTCQQECPEGISRPDLNLLALVHAECEIEKFQLGVQFLSKRRVMGRLVRRRRRLLRFVRWQRLIDTWIRSRMPTWASSMATAWANSERE